MILTCGIGIKAKWIGDSKRAVEQGKAEALKELERRLARDDQAELHLGGRRESSSDIAKTV